MQQGQPYILVVGFPDPNYAIKAVNQNKLLSPIVSSLSDLSRSRLLVQTQSSIYQIEENLV